MGASHTTLVSEADEGPPMLAEDTEALTQYALDQQLLPSSGRIMRTFRLKHKQNSSNVVLKTLWAAASEESIIREQEQELKRIKQALKGLPHVAPYMYWHTGTYRPKNTQSLRPLSLLRPFFTTTLSDRLASRPFLVHVEKLWIAYQILQALDAMHAKGVVHGFLTTENVCLSSWNWVVLVDISSYKARTKLPDDDPSEYVYYFQEHDRLGSESTRREKRCYLAPERFYSSRGGSDSATDPPLSSAMDIFSAGCVFLETFLNGERAMDLGDLMEYRKTKASNTLQQKLNKIEFSALRAACRHMLHIDPKERLSASAYLERLKENNLVPDSFEMFSTLMERLTFCKPDQRMAAAVAHYDRVIQECMGFPDAQGAQYMKQALGPTMAKIEQTVVGNTAADTSSAHNKTISDTKGPEEPRDLLKETETLLQTLENLNFDDDVLSAIPPMYTATDTSSKQAANTAPDENGSLPKSSISKESLLIYLQLFLSNCAHVQRPTSRIVALQAIGHLAHLSCDETRLQRIVPVAVSLLHDQDSLVRAAAIRLLASSLSMIESFPPSDSKIFPQYVFKRVAHLTTDPSLVVRIAFAECIGILAEISMRFLDVSHAVRLYEAIGGGTAAGNSSSAGVEAVKGRNSVFADDIANLLDAEPKKKHLEPSDSGVESSSSDVMTVTGKNVINTAYNSEVAALHECVSRWVVHITTDQSEHSSPTKRALLKDLPRLCTFFGLDGVMAFILPQILSFLNDRKDWQLRCSLFECLPSVCHIIGRAATEHYVLPCLEAALVDEEEVVVCTAVRCLSQLIQLHLLSRSLVIGTRTDRDPDASNSLLKKYSALLIHPSTNIRHAAAHTVQVASNWLGFPDSQVFIVPLIRPFLRFQPSSQHLNSLEGIMKCLQKPWPRKKYQNELDSLQRAKSALSPTEWTSIGFHVSDGPGNESLKVDSTSKQAMESSDVDLQTQGIRNYLKMVTKGRAKSSAPNQESGLKSLQSAIEGPVKLAQSIRFPRQDAFATFNANLPEWYNTLRGVRENLSTSASESAGIRSVSGLGQVYGLSIMDQSVVAGSCDEMKLDHAEKLLTTDESKTIEAAFAGEWGSEVSLDPALTDTSLLITKLNALQVPTLPPKLAEKTTPVVRPTQTAGRGSTKDSFKDRKSKFEKMISSSNTMSSSGHTAPVVRIAVSNDQHFFTTASHDGTCRVWEASKVDQSSGILESSLTYSGHLSQDNSKRVRINDMSIIDSSHSIISGASDGSVHAWRVDLSANSSSAASGQAENVSSKVIGSSELRQINPEEGEILVVNHFNSASASIMLFGSQAGHIHSWDLRCSKEPFTLEAPQGTGYLTSMALGNDRHWIVTGTSKGFLALWDLRFQKLVKLWRHSREAPINRLATSFVAPPQTWGSKSIVSDALPCVFAASGPNECGMFDLIDGSCRECFRTVEYGNRFVNNSRDEIPSLREISITSSSNRRALLTSGLGKTLADVLPSSFHSLNAIVGSIGAMDTSFLITGGSDGKIRHWDFGTPARCYVSSGLEMMQPKPSFERIDYDKKCRLMLCRQAPAPPIGETENERLPKRLMQSTNTEENRHNDSIQDLKLVNFGLISCSRDCTVKVWR